jgi:rod shape-determining protein MreC
MLALVVLSLVLATADQRHQHGYWLHRALNTLVAPLQRVVAIPADVINWISFQTTSRQRLLAENEALKTELFMLKAQALRLGQLEAENGRLRALLGAVEARREKRQVADILRVHASEFRHEVVINRGSRHQVYVGQPVLDADGVMGQVIEVSPLTARVMLITDERSGIPVRNLRNGIRSIAAGTGSLSRLELLQVPHSFDIETDDLLVTSGLGGHFPPGLPVARVSLIRHDLGQPYAYVEAVPLARLDRSGQVILLWVEQGSESDQGGHP